MLGVSRVIDAVTGLVGRWIYWLILAAVLVSAGNAISRKLLDISSNAWLELQWYLFGAVFMLMAAHTLRCNEHIRIDIISNMLSKRVRDWIDIVGHVLFLLPLTLVMIWELGPWVLANLTSGEMSGNAGGLILWPVRLCILVGFVLLFFQALSELIKRIAVMRLVIPDLHADQRPAHLPVPRLAKPDAE